jgi:PAS domain S-box-containing protein
MEIGLKAIINKINQILDVPSLDPDDARRRKLLNILLLGLVIVGILALLATISVDIAGLAWAGQDRLTAYLGSISLLIVPTILFAINRYWAGWLSSALLLLFLTVAAAFTDEPQHVVDGRGLLVFAIPIMMGSILLRPYASFIMAGLSSLVVVIMKLRLLEGAPNPFAILIFFILALIAWLAAQTLERALRDLRAINRELDQRVEERTRDLAEALSKTEAILEGIADGVIVFDNHGVSTVANPATTYLLGKPSTEIVGSELEVLIQDINTEDQEVIRDLVKDSLKSYPGLKFQWGTKTLSASFSAVRDNVGRRTGTVAVFRDFTREAELERMKSTFVSKVSHELRTPLNAIIGYADMLQETVYGPITDKQQGALDRIIVNSKRQLSIVNDLLDQAQIEAGTLKIKVAPFAPSDLITSVMDVMEVLAQSKGLELTSHTTDGVPPTLPGDRQRLHQILINLVGNAIKFTDEGSVHIRIYHPNATHWAMEVSDTGCGIPLEAQSYIFDPFRQVDGSTTREHTGSGLGLSIVKQLTTLMGGEITLKSKTGKGSTFTVILPLVPIQEESL